ncbi:hypothetical protein B0T19DRAFT_484769 [Cercophora scortea]|uniref:LCCL domain-containing protein n=1 Tax=Cercophora scortea TaxID=314031 RepID=A0AAE0IMD3_9PEZI|nr:hypothetical protein B0T19DRAFT_484769 [Cercophora scortea]
MGGPSTEVHDVERQESTIASASATTIVEHPDAPIDDVVHVAELEEPDSRPPTPRFIQDESSWKRWKWVPYPVRRFTIAVGRWTRGPPIPQDFKIKPLFPQIQHAPIALLDKYLPRRAHRIWLYFGYLAVWLITFILVMRSGLVATEVEGWGTPIPIGCGNANWISGNGCGLDGNDCRPFSGSGFAFRCPANCASYQVLNPRAVGDQEIIYQPMVIGGPSNTSSDANAVYRGDSFICGAAIHAGVITDTEGGCGVVNLIGTRSNFNSSTRHGISSISFDSYFPLSFTFDNAVQCASKDVRWSLLAISVVFSTFLALFTTSPALFYFPIFTGLYWTVALATDPPNYQDIPSLLSLEVGRFLPAMLAGWVMFDKMGIRRTLTGLTAQVEKAVLWLGACWVGALTNHTFDFIPIQRLTPHDLAQQPGARAALAIIIIVLVVIFVSQVWFFRQEGRLISHLKLYAIFGVGLIICVLLPNLSLRIHHYILALLLLPGTSMQTRPSLLYQGLLVGFFVNGIARWGWDPVLQTAYALQGDAQLDSPLPEILAPVIELGKNLSTITFSWGQSPGPEYDGISVLVNDVERYRDYFSDDLNIAPNFTWSRQRGDVGEFEKEYFRFAWMSGSSSEDYTKAGVWDEKGQWTEMQPGPSKLKRRGADGWEGAGFIGHEMPGGKPGFEVGKMRRKREIDVWEGEGFIAHEVKVKRPGGDKAKREIDVWEGEGFIAHEVKVKRPGSTLPRYS